MFDQIFGLVLGHEGGFTVNPDDTGNWTGGARGVGELKGTNFGISAASYPHLDIPNLTVDDAKAIYRRDYWDQISGDHLPPALALLVFDAAVNNGVGRARQWLTLAQAAQNPAAEFHARRINFMAQLPGWKNFGLGWARRLSRLAFEAAALK